MTTHDQIVTQESHLIIYIDERDINDKIDVSTITFFFSNDNSSSIMIEKEQICLSSLTNYTMYSKKIIELNLTLKIMKTYFDGRSIIIFVDSQAARVSDMSNNPTPSNPRVGQIFLPDGSSRVFQLSNVQTRPERLSET
jgi:hypothetical protein